MDCLVFRGCSVQPSEHGLLSLFPYCAIPVSKLYKTIPTLYCTCSTLCTTCSRLSTVPVFCSTYFHTFILVSVPILSSNYSNTVQYLLYVLLYDSKNQYRAVPALINIAQKIVLTLCSACVPFFSNIFLTYYYISFQGKATCRIIERHRKHVLG
jgi:hypothetical protein